MDSLITAAAQALAVGDTLGALNRVALRNDPPALALRGIAMAQMGDLERARVLLRQASRAFGPKEAVARARCVVAEAEIALVSRELIGSGEALNKAQATLERHGDRLNAAHARYLAARYLVLIGKLDEAERTTIDLKPQHYPPALGVGIELVRAGIAMRRIRAGDARAAAARAERAARLAAIPALNAEVESVLRQLDAPVARVASNGSRRLLLLDDVERLLASNALIVDSCRHVVRRAGTIVSLRSRPVLSALARALAGAWPDDVPRSELLTQAFGAKHADESHRARLRVEIGRLRRELRKLADVSATSRGFQLIPHGTDDVAVLAPPVEEEHADVLALLADGEAWSSSALALALGKSQRTVQRALEDLAGAQKVQSFGHGRARRWLTPTAPGFPTSLLLPAPLPNG